MCGQSSSGKFRCLSKYVKSCQLRYLARLANELRDGSTIGNSIGGVTSMLQRVVVTFRSTWR